VNIAGTRLPVRSLACLLLMVLAAAALLLPGCASGPPAKMNGYTLTPAMQSLLAQYPAPGQLIDEGSYKLHIDETGKRESGAPAVIFEAGAGNFSTTWCKVAPVIGQTVDVYVYDRAGLGWSGPGRKPRTADTIIAELHDLLHDAGVKPPYVFVAHSMGAVYARMFAHKFQGEVKGLVLVDPGSEYMVVDAGQEARRDLDTETAQAAAKLKEKAAVVATGKYADDLSGMPLLSGLTDFAAKQTQALMASEPWMWDTQAEEGLAAEESWAEARAENISSLGDIPLSVITSGQPVQLVSDPAANTALNTAWRARQQQMAGESTRGTYSIAQKSGHNIMLDQPDIVIKQIKLVLNGVAQK